MKLFENFDFSQLDSPDFKEDSVREILILPILETLGFKYNGLNKIIRSRTLKHPFVKVGSKERAVKITPDYLLETNGKPLWVLDAKSPNEEIKSGKHPEQVYSYAIHPEIRANYFCLCNGREFVVFLVNQKQPVLTFHLQELESYWSKLIELLGPASATTTTPLAQSSPINFDYLARKPPSEIGDVKRQDASRHYGVHGYRCATYNEELGIEYLRVQIDWKGFTDKQIIEAFKTWLVHNRRAGVANRRGVRKQKGYGDYLSWLGIMRLMNAYAFTGIENTKPDAYSHYQSADWPRARKKSLDVFKGFFPFLPKEDMPIHWQTAGRRAN